MDQSSDCNLSSLKTALRLHSHHLAFFYIGNFVIGTAIYCYCCLHYFYQCSFVVCYTLVGSYFLTMFLMLLLVIIVPFSVSFSFVFAEIAIFNYLFMDVLIAYQMID